MLKLYFGNTLTVISTLLVVLFIGFFSLILIKRSAITHWGLMILLLTCLGFAMSIMSGLKDGMGTPAQVIPNTHWVMIVLNLLGFACVGLAIASIFVRTQEFRQLAFFIISGMIITKVLTTEIFRIVHYFSTLT